MAADSRVNLRLVLKTCPWPTYEVSTASIPKPVPWPPVRGIGVPGDCGLDDGSYIGLLVIGDKRKGKQFYLQRDIF